MDWKTSCSAVLALGLIACSGGGGTSATGGGSPSAGGGTGPAAGGGAAGGGALLGGGAPGGGAGANTGGGTAGASGSGWTVLVYMVADNDLEPFALLDLQELGAVGSREGLSLIAQVDRSPKYSSASVLGTPDWATTKRFVVGNGSLTEVADLGALDMAAAGTLADFIAWGLASHPANKVALILWDHGGGALFGFGLDESSGNIMSVPALREGLSVGLTRAGRSRLDIIGFDACLMGTFEVAEAVRPFANYLVASEESEPGHGWDYRVLAAADGNTSPESFGRKLLDGYRAQAQSATWHDDTNITLALTDLSKLGHLEDALTALGSTYASATSVSPVLGAIGQGLSDVLTFGDAPDPSKAYNLVDLADFFTKAPTVQGASAVAAAVREAVVYQVTGTATANAHGLSIYFPRTAAYYNAAKYEPLVALSGAKGIAEWKSFLASLFGGGATAAAPMYVPNTATYNATATGLTVYGDVNDVSLLADAYMVYGLWLDEGGRRVPVLLGQIEASLTGTRVTGTWNWSILSLTQQQGANVYAEYGYFSLQQLNTTQGLAAIPLVYAVGSTRQEAVRAIVFNLSDGTIASDRTFLSSASGLLGELSAQPGGTLHAEVAILPDANTPTLEWTLFDPQGAGFDATRPISLSFDTSVSSGAAVFGGLKLENASGQGDWLNTPNNVKRP